MTEDQQIVDLATVDLQRLAQEDCPGFGLSGPRGGQMSLQVFITQSCATCQGDEAAPAQTTAVIDQRDGHDSAVIVGPGRSESE